MAKDQNTPDLTGAGSAQTEGLNDPAKTPQRAGMPVTIVGQYIRDVSFENPHAPEMLWQQQGQPALEVGFQMGAHRIENKNQNDMFEVTLTMTAKARFDNVIAYIVEIEYAVLVVLNDVPKDKQHPMLLIKVPELAFPFVREIAANLTMQGGYYPLLLAPVDFRAMYMERFGRKEDVPQKEAATA